MSSFPLADQIGAREKDGVWTNRGPKVEVDHKPVRVDLAQMLGAQESELGKYAHEDLRQRLLYGSQAERREAFIRLEVWDRIESGKYDRVFIHEHPVLMVDRDRQAYTSNGSAMGLGEHLPDVSFDNVPDDIPFEDSRSPEGAQRLEMEAKLKHARANPMDTKANMKDSVYVGRSSEKVRPGPQSLG